MDEARLTRVWEPLDVGPVRVKNRIMVSGQSQFYGHDGVVSDRHIAYYEERAKGGAGLLVLEAQAVHPACRHYHDVCNAWEPRAVPHYRRLVDAVHKHETRQFVQLLAYGAQGSSTQYIDSWQPLWSASGIPNPVCSEKPMAMEQAHVDDLIAHFVLSARNAQEAGFDGIEIHAAHSLLLGEFLSPTFNRRTDRYGGSTRARCQLVIEVAEAIRAVVGTGLALGIRLSLDEHLGEVGISQDEGAAQVEILHETGLFDFFDISVGGYYSLHMIAPPMGRVKQGFLAPLSRRAKEIVGSAAKVFVVGRVLDLAAAEDLLATGATDMVAMTRAQVADPFLVNKTLEGRSQEIQRCVGANVCLKSIVDNRPMACLMNPSTGRERELGEGTLVSVSPDASKRVLVAGGGPAGLKVAGVAARRGHRVTLCERGSELGGHLNALKALPSRSEWQVAIDNLMQPLKARGVEIRLETSVDRSLALGGDFDTVVCATGSTWDPRGASSFRPDRDAIPGAELSHVFDAHEGARRAVSDPRSLGRKVLIVDESEGYLPLGIAEQLASAGASVEIVTPRAVLGGQTMKTAEMYFVGPRLRQLGVRWRTEHFVEKIEEDHVTLYHVLGGDPEDVAFDAVVLCLFREPRNELYRELRTERDDVYCVGDAVAPQPLEAVIYEAEMLGRAL